MMEEVPCTPSSLKLICLRGNTTSGCGVIDVTIPQPSWSKIHEIRFRNNYTASIAIKARVAGYEDKFVTLVESFPLMKSPHYANESQKSFNIKVKPQPTTEENFSGLRLILRQPSSVWDKFGLEDIRLYRSVVESHVDVVDSEKSLQCTDNSLGCVLDSMHELRKQIESIRSHHVEFDPAPFDIGGCYDINLLSYT